MFPTYYFMVIFLACHARSDETFTCHAMSFANYDDAIISTDSDSRAGPSPVQNPLPSIYLHSRSCSLLELPFLLPPLGRFGPWFYRLFSFFEKYSESKTTFFLAWISARAYEWNLRETSSSCGLYTKMNLTVMNEPSRRHPPSCNHLASFSWSLPPREALKKSYQTRRRCSKAIIIIYIYGRA